MKDGWDVYFTPGFCGGTIQPGYVIRYRNRWYRTKHRVDPMSRRDVLTDEQAATIKANLPKLPNGNAKFHAYLRAMRKNYTDVPLFDMQKLGANHG
jgi:hypothetical protein